MNKKTKLSIAILALAYFGKKCVEWGYSIGKPLGYAMGLFDAYKPEVMEAVRKSLQESGNAEEKEETSDEA